MARYMVFPREARVHKISRDVPPAHAAFAEPLSCALHAVDRANIHFDDVVVVAGAGPIGLGMVAGSAAKTPAAVVALDMILELTDGLGADVYLEGTGQPSAVEQGLTLLRKRGRFIEYSVFGSDVTVDWSIISDDKELDVLGAHLGPHCWPAAIRMIESGSLPLDRICSHQLPLAKFKEGLDLVDKGTDSIKVSLIPS
jgi:threonine dehydrogenase-like Zn-dependent dehydrogenase